MRDVHICIYIYILTYARTNVHIHVYTCLCIYVTTKTTNQDSSPPLLPKIAFRGIKVDHTGGSEVFQWLYIQISDVNPNKWCKWVLVAYFHANFEVLQFTLLIAMCWHGYVMQMTRSRCEFHITIQITYCSVLTRAAGRYANTTHKYKYSVHINISNVNWDSLHIGIKDTEWRRLIGCLKLQVILRKRATQYRALLRKMTYKHKASYDSTPLCMWIVIQYTYIYVNWDSLHIGTRYGDCDSLHININYSHWESPHTKIKHVSSDSTIKYVSSDSSRSGARCTVLRLECHVFFLESQSMIKLSRSLLQRSVEKRRMWLRLEIEFQWHFRCNWL